MEAVDIDATQPITGLLQGREELERCTDVLLGSVPDGRKVRIMVTMPSEAADESCFVKNLVDAGMNVMRINCAHDGPKAWSEMIRNLRRAEKKTGKALKVEMDLAGPKLRTGSIEPGPAVIKYSPQRDSLGRVIAPARIWLTPEGQPETPTEKADACVPLPAAWLKRLKRSVEIRFVDARKSKRTLEVRGRVGASWWAEGMKSAYLVSGAHKSARCHYCHRPLS